MSNWHWVQTHHISSNSDNTGHATLTDVLGSSKHNIHAFVDPAHQIPLTINHAYAYDNGRQIPVTRLCRNFNSINCVITDPQSLCRKPNAFSIQLPNNRIQNHVTLKIAANRRNHPVYIAVWQYQARPMNMAPPSRPHHSEVGPSSSDDDCCDCCVIA